MQVIDIRHAMPADLDQLLAMVQDLTRYHHDTPQVTAATLERDVFGAVPWFQVLVAAEGARLIGYAALLPLARMGYGMRGADLHHLFVVEDQRSRGIGTTLIEAAVTQAREMACDYMIIGTHPANRAAQAYYAKLGFEVMPATSVRFTKRMR